MRVTDTESPSAGLSPTDEGAVESDRGDGPLGRQVTKSFRWSVAGQILTRIGVFATGIVLARTLTPHDFGVYAVALAAFNLLMMLNEVGMVAAIVRAPDDELTEAVRTGATLAFAMSLIVAAVAFVAAPWFASALGTAAATGILRLFIVSLIIDGAMTAPMALLGRAFKQGRMVAAEAGGLVVYMGTASALAFAGAGPWSIAVGRVAASVVTGILLLIFSPRLPRPGLDRAQVRKLLRFGIPLTFAAIIAEAVMNVDYLVVGKVLGAASLGIYLLAFNLSTWPVSAVLVAIGRVAFPAFARVAHDRKRMARAYVQAVGLIVTAIIPIVVLLAALSHQVIHVVYGDRWLPASTPLRYLLVLAVGRVVIQTTLEFIAARGQPGTNLKIQAAWLIALTPALIFGARRWGIAGVGVGHMTVVALWVAPLLAIAIHRAGVDLRDVGMQLLRPLLAALGAWGAVELTLLAVHGAQLVELVVAGAAGTVVYIALVAPFNPLVSWGIQQVRPGRQVALAEA